MKLVILGNAGSGKTTLARSLAEEQRARSDSAPAILALDEIAFVEGATRKPLAESLTELERFLGAHSQWIVEGCYGDLAEAALRHADELRWLDVDVATCQERCRSRPYEPSKFATPHAQREMLEPLLSWVAEYEERDDEFGRKRHRAIYAAFDGAKQKLGAGC